MRILKEIKKQFLKNFAKEKYRKKMQKYYHQIKNVDAKIYKDKDGFFIIKSINYVGIISYGRTEKEANENFKDAILTYFKVPYEYSETKLIRNVGEEKSREETFKVFAIN